MTFNIPHSLGDEISGPAEGDEICVKIDGTVKRNSGDKLVIEVDEVTVRNYTDGDSEDEEYDDEEEGDNPAPIGSDGKHGIVIAIMKKK